MGVELREGRVSGVPFSQCGLGIHVLHTTCMSIDGVVTCGGYSLWLRPTPRRAWPPPSRACCVGQARSAQRTPRRVSPRRPFCCHGVRSLAAARSTVQTCCIMEAIPEKKFRAPGRGVRECIVRIVWPWSQQPTPTASRKRPRSQPSQRAQPSCRDDSAGPLSVASCACAVS